MGNKNNYATLSRAMAIEGVILPQQAEQFNVYIINALDLQLVSNLIGGYSLREVLDPDTASLIKV